MTPPPDAEVAATILDLAEARGPGRTFCPSEAARRLAGEWRPLMPRLRRVAADLAADGRIAVTQKGRSVEARTVKGPIRLGRPTDVA